MTPSEGTISIQIGSLDIETDSLQLSASGTLLDGAETLILLSQDLIVADLQAKTVATATSENSSQTIVIREITSAKPQD